MSRLVLSLLLVLSCLTVSGAAFAEPKPPAKIDNKVAEAQVFRYKYRAGQKFSYTSKITQQSKIEAKGGPGAMPGGDMVTTITNDFTNTAVKVLPSGEAGFERSNDTLVVGLTQGGKALPTDQLKPQIEGMRKVKLTYQTDPQGQRSGQKVEGLPGGGQVSNPIQDMLNDGIAVFPNQGVKVGEVWKRKLPVDINQGVMILKFSVAIDTTFLGYVQEGPRRLAVFQTQVYLLLLNQEGKMPGHKVEVQGSGKGAGYFYFDQKEGVLVRNELEFTQSLTTSIGAGDQGTQSVRVETKAAIEVALKGAN